MPAARPARRRRPGPPGSRALRSGDRSRRHRGQGRRHRHQPDRLAERQHHRGDPFHQHGQGRRRRRHLRHLPAGRGEGTPGPAIRASWPPLGSPRSSSATPPSARPCHHPGTQRRRPRRHRGRRAGAAGTARVRPFDPGARISRTPGGRSRDVRALVNGFVLSNSTRAGQLMSSSPSNCTALHATSWPCGQGAGRVRCVLDPSCRAGRRPARQEPVYRREAGLQ